jgi:uracil-DNA glycosylase
MLSTQFVRSEWQQKTPIYPPADMVFRAFNTCAFERIRVVILGQDPYHGPEQAMGLCFSVPRGAKVPSSLLNMYKELGTDLGCTRCVSALNQPI